MKYITEAILKPVCKIAGGADLPHFKNTAESETISLPTPEKVVIPLKQHIGATCEPCVKAGDCVLVGTLIADSDKPFSAPIHSSISGTVKEITEIGTSSGEKVPAIVIESDGLMKEEELSPIEIKTPEDLIAAARNSGLVGLGGAGFPTHIKLAPAVKEEIDTLIVNGAECEPYITSDYRTCIEDYDDLFDGLYLLKEIFDFKNIIIAVEANKPIAIKKLYDIAADRRDTLNTVHLMKLSTRYPQGAEKMLVYTTTGRKVPAGKLPADVGCVVMNITTIATLNKYIRTGMPLVSKRITVDGNGVGKTANISVPIGTQIKDVFAFCEGKEDIEKVLYGGPMMGVTVDSMEAPIMKQNNAILFFSNVKTPKTTPCIRCGRCANTCPMLLTPAKVNGALKLNNIDALSTLNIAQCIECGCCSYTCPAGIPLTQQMRTAKSILRRKK